MSHDPPADETQTFGEKLLGLQGFTATRARRYRQELEELLVHRISAVDRWIMGASGIVIGSLLIVFGILLAVAKPHPEDGGFEQARLTLAVTTAMTGLALGGWLLRIGIQGGYGRRRGDHVGVLIALLLCVGWGFALMNIAWGTSDPVLRTKLLMVGGTMFLIGAACVVIAHFQRLHRQTQEKLLRIEYHLAELMERTSGQP